MWGEMVQMPVNPKSLKNLKPFPPGVSGNPAGTPKGKRWRTVIQEILDQAAILSPPKTKKDAAARKKLLTDLELKLGRKPTNRDVVAFYQMIKAQEGNTSAFKAIADREEGRSRPECEGLGDDLPDSTEPLTSEQMAELVRIARSGK